MEQDLLENGQEGNLPPWPRGHRRKILSHSLRVFIFFFLYRGGRGLVVEVVSYLGQQLQGEDDGILCKADAGPAVVT